MFIKVLLAYICFVIFISGCVPQSSIENNEIEDANCKETINNEIEINENKIDDKNNDYSQNKDFDERATIKKIVDYMTLEEITALGVYPQRMQPNTIITYNEQCSPTILEGGELTYEEVCGNKDIEELGYVLISRLFAISPNSKVEYDSYGFIQNIYYTWPDKTGYWLAPPNYEYPELPNYE